MKRYLSLILCAVMLLGVFTSCSTLKGDDKGMVLDVYMSTPIVDFDPALHFNDDALTKIFDMIYEGLTDLDENGKWFKALMKNYKYTKNKDGSGYTLLIKLNLTKWTDGRTVQAQDFVYAWKRILDPDFRCEAAAMLYDIRNAFDVKMGDASIDDLGVAAVDTYALEIYFDHDIDVNHFFEMMASPAMVPLREDIVSRDKYWAKQTSTIVTNGPFALKALNKGEIMRLERSNYYYLNAEDETEPLDHYVIPYRLLTQYAYGDTTVQLAKFEAGELYYIDEIPLASRKQYKDTATVTDNLNTLTYVFNESNKLFQKAEVRRALSMALDRNAIADIVTFAAPATGLIGPKVFDATTGSSFRAVGGELIKTAADVSGAKSLLSSAGVTSGKFTITIRSNDVDRAVADYVKGVWEGLGFTVTVRELDSSKVAGYDNAYLDDFTEAYYAGDYDVIGIDMLMLGTDPWCTLAPFASKFSGNGVDMNSANYDVKGHNCGYLSADYDAIIEKAFEDKTVAGRTAVLHDAEKKLMEDMPVCPLVFLQDAYLIHPDLSGYKSYYYGTRDFKRMKNKNYVPVETEEEIPGAATTAAK